MHRSNNKVGAVLLPLCVSSMLDEGCTLPGEPTTVPDDRDAGPDLLVTIDQAQGAVRSAHARLVGLQVGVHEEEARVAGLAVVLAGMVRTRVPWPRISPRKTQPSSRQARGVAEALRYE